MCSYILYWQPRLWFFISYNYYTQVTKICQGLHYFMLILHTFHAIILYVLHKYGRQIRKISNQYRRLNLWQKNIGSPALVTGMQLKTNEMLNRDFGIGLSQKSGNPSTGVSFLSGSTFPLSSTTQLRMMAE